MIKKEISIHKPLIHKNIIKLYDYFIGDKWVFLIMEYA